MAYKRNKADKKKMLYEAIIQEAGAATKRLRKKGFSRGKTGRVITSYKQQERWFGYGKPRFVPQYELMLCRLVLPYLVLAENGQLYEVDIGIGNRYWQDGALNCGPALTLEAFTNSIVLDELVLICLRNIG